VPFAQQGRPASVHATTLPDGLRRCCNTNNPGTAKTLIRTAGVPILNESNTEDAIVRLAWYYVFATRDIQQQMGGQPFDNIGRLYFGSGNDLLLNLSVERAAADARAIAALERYETSGNFSAPLVTVHTTADPVIPYWHEWWYSAKATWGGKGSLLTTLPVVRYGHCEFNASEVLFSFGLMLFQAGIRPAPKIGGDESFALSEQFAPPMAALRVY
jgi:hypothetical protein